MFQFVLTMLIIFGFTHNIFLREEESILKVGDKASNFSLISTTEEIITLSDYQNKKNVILVFYRGYW